MSQHDRLCKTSMFSVHAGNGVSCDFGLVDAMGFVKRFIGSGPSAASL